jgi:hypothetical protein
MKKLVLLISLLALPFFLYADNYDSAASNSVLSSLHMGHFDDIQSQAVSGALELRTYARMIAGIGALCCLLVAMWSVWVKSNSTNSEEMWSFAFRAAAVFLLIVCFDVVPLFIDACVSPLEGATAALKEEAVVEYNNKVDEFSKLFFSLKDESEVEAEVVQKGVFGKLLAIVGGIFNIIDRVFSFSGVQQMVNWAINEALITLLQMLAKAVVVCLHVFALIAKVILIILGPLVFALSMFPYFRDSIRIWLCRYINLCLYIPICNIIGYVLQYVYINIFFTPAIEALKNGGGASMAEVASSRGFMLLFFFVAIIMYCMVPRLAGWVIDGQGNGLIGSAVGNIAGVAARYGSGAAGAAAGASASVK